MTLLRLVCLGLVCCLTATAQANTVTTATLREEVNDFLGRELAAHLSAIKSLDPPPFDRYSNEYARYVWEAAEEAGRKDILEKLRPSLKAQMRLWSDVISEDGYGYNWGRSQCVVSYLDTPEIAGFLATHAEFRPAPLADIAAAYYQAPLAATTARSEKP